MMLQIVDHALAVTKETVKTFSYESLNNVVRIINGVSAIVLTIIPGKATILEGLYGWELRPTYRGPRLPRWMGNGVSSFNRLIHELSVDSDTSSLDYSSVEEDSDGDVLPTSPVSQVSRVSWANIGIEYDKHWSQSISDTVSWMLLPLTLLFRFPFRLYHLLYSRGYGHVPYHLPRLTHSPRKLQSLRDHFIQRSIDRRRGVVEDLHLAIEIFIEVVFDGFHQALHLLLSPSEVFRALSECGFPSWSSAQDTRDPVDSVGETEPPPQKRPSYSSLNTDDRTCQDVITELGYPYEAIRVVTVDGYILLLERIPRHDSRKAVFLQHGALDSSMGWVSNGVIGSVAFAAFDQGYDVFLGNSRGLVSRGHVDRNISLRQYWRFTINELGTEDIPAMIEKIHEVKTLELKLRQPDLDDNDEPPYNLCAITHSLGGPSFLMHVVTRRIEQKPHRLSRLVLLSPAGFHNDSPFLFTILEHVFLTLGPNFACILPAFYIPTRFFRMLFNKLVRDFHNYPAIGGLVQTLMGYLVGGDSSNWVSVLGLPHYNINDMPGVSYLVALHMSQMKRAGRFQMFDFGSAEANMEVYGTPEPLDLGEHYFLIDIPVDLVAGRKDTVIRASSVRNHDRLMRDANVDVTYSEFEYAHLDFTFSYREEVLAYVMSRLQLVKSTSKRLLGLTCHDRKGEEQKGDESAK